VVTQGTVEVPGDDGPFPGPLDVEGAEVVLVVSVPVLGEDGGAGVVDVAVHVEPLFEEPRGVSGVRDPAAEPPELLEGPVLLRLERVVLSVLVGRREDPLVSSR
jgi:hypothetical protein